MQGKVVERDRAFVVMDSFALPVQGTETRVNAANEANEYMVEYIQGSEKVRRRHPLLSAKLDRSLLSLFVGRKTRECDRLVSLPSWLRLLVVGH